MEFGVFDHLDRRDDPLGQFYADRLAMVAAYDRAGFHGYYVAEHHSTPLGMAPSPNVFLALVARETIRLRLGPMVYLLPLYHPVRLIEEICMLDHLSHGRLDVGVGRGISPYEVAGYGIEPPATREMFEEALDVLLNGLTHDRLDHRGKWYDATNVPMELRPLQRPHPPLWYGAANESGARFAARHGMHFVTLGGNDRVGPLIARFPELWQESANDPARAGSAVETPYIALGRHLVIADSAAEAEALGRPAYERWFASLAKLWHDHGAQPVTGMIIDSYDEARRLGQAVVGSPETVRAELSAQMDEMRFNYLLCQFAWGSLTHEQEMRSLELFVSEIMPALRDR